MKKKLIVLFLAVSILCTSSVTAFAAVRRAKFSDVVTYINNYPIPSWNYNGYTFICVEDLANYGFDVDWNEYYKSLCIIKNENKEIEMTPTYYPKASQLGKEAFQLTQTYVRTFIGNFGYEIECYAGMPGYTFINVDNLCAFGSVNWRPDVNSVEVWIEGLEYLNEPRNIPLNPYPYETVNDVSETPYYGYGVYGFNGGLVVFLYRCNDDQTVYSKNAYSMKIEVIEPDGHCRYKGEKSSYKSEFFTWPYDMGLIDGAYSQCTTVTANELKRSTSGTGDALVKVTCDEDYYYDEPISFECYVSDLPL